MTGTTSREELLARQRSDGSWGDSERATGRIISTIFAARSLQEAAPRPAVAATDRDDEPGIGRALDFLSDVAIVEGGGTIDGRHESVLSCYTGMLALLFIRAERRDEARLLLDWVVRFQPVAYGDRTYHRPADPGWGDYLRHRYGGCMAATTCLLGLVPTMHALALGRRAGITSDGQPLEEAFRQLLIDRRLMFDRRGEVIALSGRTKADPRGTGWLLPAFPLNYVIDLISLVEVAAAVGVPWEAMSAATDRLSSWRLPDGGWPMLGRRRIPYAYRPEGVSAARRSQVITARVEALGLPG